jgi:DNA-binding transcriptional LysR family regulator
VIARELQLDPDCLDALVAFAGDLNLTAAAKALHRSQPTVHAQLKRLADAVGAPLYERRGRSLALTEAGTAVLAYARESRERLSALEAALSKRRSERPVVLAAGEGALLYLLGPAIAAFRRETERAPRLLIGDREQTLEHVRSGLAQLGVTAITAQEASDLRVERVASVRSAIVVDKRHPLAARKSVRWEHLQGVALVLPPAPSGLRAAAHGALGPHIRVAIEARGWPLAMHCARLGLGVAIVNDFCEPPTGSVMRRLTDGPSPQYSLISRRDAVDGAAVAALRRAILAKVAP